MTTTSTIPFIDLATQRARIAGPIAEAMNRVVAHGQFIMGPELGQLEADLAAFCGAKHAIGCASGTDALILALLVHGIGPGDAVIVPSFTWVSTGEVVALLGATPLFVDCDDTHFLMRPADIAPAAERARALGLTPRGVIPVDLFGQPADYAAINAAAEAEGLFVIADAAQSFGASEVLSDGHAQDLSGGHGGGRDEGLSEGQRDAQAQGLSGGQGNGHAQDLTGERGAGLSKMQGAGVLKVGTMAHITTTSFFPAKPLGGFGDGGAVFTNDDEAALKMRSFLNHGQGETRADNVRIGINGRLDTLQAAVLIEKLKIFPAEIEARNQLAERYRALARPGFVPPAVREGCTSVWAQYTCRVVDRDDFRARLNAAGVPTAVYYPVPMHQQTAYRGYPCTSEAGLPVCERLAHEVVALPMHPYMSEEDFARIAEAIQEALPHA